MMYDGFTVIASNHHGCDRRCRAPPARGSLHSLFGSEVNRRMRLQNLLT